MIILFNARLLNFPVRQSWLLASVKICDKHIFQFKILRIEYYLDMLFILLFAIRSEIPCWSKTRLKIAIWFAFINNVIYLFFLSEKMVTVQSTVDTGHEVMLILPGCAKYTPLLITITIIISNVHILTWMLQERIFQFIPVVKKKIIIAQRFSLKITIRWGKEYILCNLYSL